MVAQKDCGQEPCQLELHHRFEALVWQLKLCTDEHTQAMRKCTEEHAQELRWCSEKHSQELKCHEIETAKIEAQLRTARKEGAQELCQQDACAWFAGRGEEDQLV